MVYKNNETNRTKRKAGYTMTIFHKDRYSSYRPVHHFHLSRFHYITLLLFLFSFLCGSFAANLFKETLCNDILHLFTSSFEKLHSYEIKKDALFYFSIKEHLKFSLLLRMSGISIMHLPFCIPVFLMVCFFCSVHLSRAVQVYYIIWESFSHNVCSLSLFISMHCIILICYISNGLKTIRKKTPVLLLLQTKKDSCCLYNCLFFSWVFCCYFLVRFLKVICRKIISILVLFFLTVLF